MRTKSSSMFNWSSQGDFDIIVLVETWLNSDFFDFEFFNPNMYQVYRKDRDATKTGLSRGGGVLIAVKRTLCSSLYLLLNADTLLDQLCVKISGPTGSIYVCTSYIPPNSSYDLYAAHVNNILELQALFNNTDNHLCYLGDFNLNKVIWSSMSDVLMPTNINSSTEIYVIDSILSIDLVQINSFLNSLNNILDLIFVSKNFKYNLSECLCPISPSGLHHVPLVLQFEFYEFANSLPQKNLFNFRQCNFDLLNSILLDINWSEMFLNRSVTDCYALFKSKLYSICTENIPSCKPYVYKLPWYTKGLKKLKNLRNKNMKLFKSTHSYHYQLLYVRYMREFNFLNKFLYNQYVLRIEGNIKSNPKSFWHFIQSKRDGSSIPTSTHYNGTQSYTIDDTVNLFADYFKSNYVSDSLVFDNSILNNVDSCVDLGSMVLSHEEILNALSQLKISVKVDIDGISSILLNKCALSLSFPLREIFNLSLNSGTFIDCWKMASITPVFKSGSRNDISNYRPISKLSNISKLFEILVNNRLFFLLKRHICPEQHGFFAGRSTVSNLSVFSRFCISSFDSGHQVDVIYTDFSKAFDKVSHAVLLAKLSKMGFHSNLLNWIRSYLLNRVCFVVINGCKSYHFIASSGVPQGSVLGPLLFSLFINDICKCFHFVKFLLFADDLKLFYNIASLSDAIRLQSDLNNLLSWSLTNCLPLNINKCFAMTFMKCINHIAFSYSLSGTFLQKVNTIKDLGVIFDSKFTFNNHIDYIIPKAYSMLAFVRRNSSEFSDPFTLTCLFNAFVRSRLEYASFIWSPFYITHSNRLEKVQKSFTRFALRLLNFDQSLPSYDSRLLLLGLKSLDSRRKIQSLLFIHDLVSGHIDCDQLLQLINFSFPARLLRHYNLFHLQIHRTLYSSNEPISRALSLYNELSSCNNNLDIFSSKFSFKNFLKSLFLI